MAWIVVDAVSGAERPLFDAGKMEAALSKIPGVSEADARPCIQFARADLQHHLFRGARDDRLRSVLVLV